MGRSISPPNPSPPLDVRGSKIGIIFAFFHSERKTPVSTDWLNILHKESALTGAASFKSLAEIFLSLLLFWLREILKFH